MSSGIIASYIVHFRTLREQCSLLKRNASENRDRLILRNRAEKRVNDGSFVKGLYSNQYSLMADYPDSNAFTISYCPKRKQQATQNPGYRMVKGFPSPVNAQVPSALEQDSSCHYLLGFTHGIISHPSTLPRRLHCAESKETATQNVTIIA